ncbi:hypothetical protein TrRE_jg2696 [Triparma retinervis]|uniref:Nucleoside transporter n=1 Tax=Triparma retinervis TaxID=2557542 RepID=A0A9W6ZB50_9STRA|nr:hypothetical protein TrRE_jg2696 [Triparma retinervis]
MRDMREIKPTKSAYMLITFISASYMSLWISVGTLIDYYNVRYGPLFFLFLNTSFYAPGLPISILQHRLDQIYDQYYGASTTWFFRVVGSMFILLICSLLLPHTSEPREIAGIVLLVGVSTWTAHGTLTTITSLYPTRAVGYLQFGFQVPNVFVLALVAGLGMYGISSADIVGYVEGRAGGFSLLGVGGEMSRLERFYGATTLVAPLLPKNPSSISSSSSRSFDEGLEREVLASISLHRRVLFFTIFASIFSGSLFANIPREDGYDGVDLGQILYFTRLFADLGGRVVTWLPRKYLISSISGLYYVMVVRLLLLVVFVAYIFFPPSLRSDVGITSLVALCAFQSGYNAVLVYELVGKEVGGGAGGGGKDQRCKAKAMATRALNMSFQYACAGACVCNLMAAAVAVAMDKHVQD